MIHPSILTACPPTSARQLSGDGNLDLNTSLNVDDDLLDNLVGALRLQKISPTVQHMPDIPNAYSIKRL